MRRLILLAILLTLSGPDPVAGAPITIGGTIRTVDGSAIAEALVELRPLVSNYERSRMILAGRATVEPVATTQTDAAGRFAIAAPGAGVWRVVVRPTGYVTMRYGILPVVQTTELPAVTVLPDVGTRIEIRRPSGEPASGVWVLAETASENLWKNAAVEGWRVGARIARSGIDGIVTLPRAPEEQLTIHAFLPESTTTDRGQAQGRGSVVLEASDSCVRVIEIVDGEQRPMRDVVVTTGELSWPAGTTDENGRLHLRCAGSDPVRIGFFAADDRRQREQLSAPPAGETGPIRFLLGPLQRLSGRIITADDRQPLAGTLVWPVHDPGSFVLTDSQGLYDVVAPPGDRFLVHAEAAGFLPGRVSIRRGDERARDAGARRAPTLALKPAATVSGRVMTKNGQPLAAVRIEAIPLTTPKRQISNQVVSRSDGRFTLPGLDPAAAYELTAVSEGFAPATLRIDGPQSIPAHKPLRIVLEKARPAFGRVVDGQERALPGTEVRVAVAGHRSLKPATEATVIVALSDQRGEYKLDALPGDKVDLHARKKGYSPLTVRGIEVPPGTGPVDLGTLVLAPGMSITGRITDAGQRPIAGAELRTTNAEGRPPRGRMSRIRQQPPATVTGADGRFAVEDLESGRRIHLLVTAGGYLPAWVVGVEVPNRKALAVVLEPAAAVGGQVVDEQGRPVAGARVRVRGKAPAPGTVGVESRVADLSKTTITDLRGNFTIAELPPAEVEIKVTAAGYLPAPPLVVDVPAGRSIDGLRFVLERGAVVEGRITGDAQGEPVAGAQVRLTHAVAFSDAEGIYRLEGVPRGEQTLAVKHLEFRQWYRTIEIEDGVNRVDVTLHAGWPVTGSVADEDESPVTAASIELVPDFLGDRRRYRTTTEVDGGFAFPRVVDGIYHLRADKEGYGAVELHRGVEVKRGPVNELQVVLVRGAAVVGRLVGLELSELAGAEVEAEQDEQTRRSGTVDYAGRYRIDDLSPGAWLVTARVPGTGRQAEAQLVIDAGVREVSQDLEFGSGINLSGIVSYLGVPLPETRVTVDGHDFAVRRTVMTDHEGTFRIENLKPGRYRLGLTNVREVLYQNEEILIPGDRHVHLEFLTARISGTVISATTSQPLADALVFIDRLLGTATEAASRITVATDGEGRFTLGKLSAGRYRIWARMAGYGPGERMIQFEPGVDVDEVELVLEPTQGLDMMLRLASGRSAKLATVAVLDPSGRLLVKETQNVRGDGYVRFATVPPGTWALLVSAPGAAVTRVRTTVPGPAPELVLAPGSRLTVRVPAVVEANAYATLTVTAQNGQRFEALDQTGVLRREWRLSGGHGIVEGIPPGVWTLTAVTPGGLRFQQTIAVAGGEAYEVILQ